MSNEPIAIDAAQLIAEIEQAAMRREDARVNYYLRQTSERLDLLLDARREHMRLVAELAGLPVREERP